MQRNVAQLIQELNEEQRQAVEHLDGFLLVIAGAGSGKTRVVTLRIAYLIAQGIPPSRILGLTFTNKAANEMKERVASFAGCPVLVCTFHSLGAKILRESIELLGWQRNFVIYDSEDVEKLLKMCLVELSYSEKKGDMRAISTLISRAKNALLSPDAVDTTALPAPLQEPFPAIFSLYKAKLKLSNAVDFDDLLVLPLELFAAYPEVLEQYQRRWDYLLIDEYQDTNTAQYTLVRHLAHKNGNICAVGDPDQSIYSWRGANIENILGFSKEHAKARVVRLERNYRSTTTILEAANALIANNVKRWEKNLWSGLGAGEKIGSYTAENERGEAAFIAAVIRYHHECMGVPYREMAIFYRTNAQSRPFEDVFLSYKIPYCLIGGLSFYQRREIKDILAFLRLAQSGNDFVAFARTINLPKRGLGAATLEKLRVGALQENMALIDYCRSLVYDRLPAMKLSVKQKKALAEYLAVIDKIRHTAQGGALRDIICEAIAATDYLQWLKEDPESYEERKENLDALITKAVEWEHDAEEPSLNSFLEELTLKTTLDEAEGEQDKVNLMTIHNGKGLEFVVAFLAGMEEELFPHANARVSDAALEEERRLCYVGMTRAKRQLYFTSCWVRHLWGSERMQRPSRFLKEIPLQYVAKLRTPPRR